MKQLLFILLGACFFLFSCLDKDISQKDETPQEGKDAPNFSFQNTKEKSVTIYAMNSSGEYIANVPVSIYNENPYNEDGVKDPNITRMFYGVTDDGGKLEAELNKVPNSVSELYILTEWPGFGGMQVYNLTAGGDVTLAGPQIEEENSTKAVLRADDETVSYTGKLINAEMNLYTYLNNNINKQGIPQIDKNLVSQESPSAGFLSLVSNWYPEAKNVQDEKYLKDPQYCTDMEIKDEYGCEIWATYIGDGGFSNANGIIKNMLCYYQYEGSHNTLSQPNSSKSVHKTIIFNNTNQREMIPGRKVQLLYWNGNEYVKTFPKGTHIGWALIQEGYNGNAYNNTTAKNVNNYRFSTLELSTVGTTKTTQGIARWSEEFKCNIVGMENREIGHRAYDGDYNDILFSVTATPVIKPEVDIPTGGDPTGDIITTERYGTLAFEDMFPHKGDWDHNDLVVDYSYIVEQNQNDAKATAIVLDFDIRAIGATRTNGLGIELPIKRSEIKRVTGGNFEGTGNLATIIVSQDTRELFNNATGIINTYNNLEQLKSSGAISIRIEFNQSQSNINMNKFNPFIFVDNRKNEIHLPDYRPTAGGNVSFGIMDDATNGENSFYKTNERHAWGLDIPRLQATDPSWIYPLEGNPIEKAYPDYATWAESNGTDKIEWYNNPNSEMIYSREE